MGMGNVTLAVPDLENEVWNNPAKMTSVQSPTIHLTPTYGTYSNTTEQYSVSSYSYIESYTHERTFSQGTTDLIIPL